jgi:hypothetical protein
MTGADLSALTRFYEQLGMRKVIRLPNVAILELRGGTHLAIERGAPRRITLDLMVDDIDAAHALTAALDGHPTAIERAWPHRIFRVTDPEGNTVLIHSSHAAGPV